MRRKFQGKYRGKWQELDENRHRACRKNKQDGIPGGQAVATQVNFPGAAPAKAHSFQENYNKEHQAGSC